MRASASWKRRNPPATAEERERAHAVARRIAEEEARAGASAVLLSGSWARGDAHHGSDLDLWVLGQRTGLEFSVRDGFLVSVSRKTVANARAELRDPYRVGTTVPAWREAFVLRDPGHTAGRLKRAAAAFRWESIAKECDRFVTETLVTWAEEAVKLTRMMAEGRWASAAVQRNKLANRMPEVMAVARRIFYDENRLPDAVAEVLGEDWTTTHACALALEGDSLEDSCQAALDLYSFCARVAGPILEPDQKKVVREALELAGHSL